jgi:hypothetical protein
MNKNDKKILVFLTSFMEPELENTIKSFYENAEYKDRILFSISSQDKEFVDLSFVPEKNLRYLKIDASETYGYMWSKKIASVQFSDFDYFFSIDGHMMAQKFWDSNLINLYEEVKEKYKKVILNARPIGYKVFNEKRLTTRNENIGEDTEENRASDILTISHSIIPNGSPDWWPTDTIIKYNIQEVYYIWASCVFGEKEFLLDVPIDPEMSFYHEERSWSIRAISKGYKIIAFKNPKFYHMYYNEREAYKKVIRFHLVNSTRLDPEVQKLDRYKNFLSMNLDKEYRPTQEAINFFISKMKDKDVPK